MKIVFVMCLVLLVNLRFIVVFCVGFVFIFVTDDRRNRIVIYGLFTFIKFRLSRVCVFVY